MGLSPANACSIVGPSKYLNQFSVFLGHCNRHSRASALQTQTSAEFLLLCVIYLLKMLSSYQELVDKSAILLYPKEHVLWAGKPQKAPYLLHSFWSALWLMIVVLVFIYVMGFFPKIDPQYPPIIGLQLLCIVLRVWYGWKEWRNTLYVITNKQIILHRKVFSININYVPLADINTKELNRSLADKRYGTGTIVFRGSDEFDDDGYEYNVYSFHSIDGAEEVFEMVKTSPES